LTEKIAVDGGDEQTVTFAAAYDQAQIVSSNEWPVSTQDTLTEKVTIDGGAEQTVTFSGALTTAAHIAAAMDAQLTGCKVRVVGTNVVITSDSKGTGSSVAIGTGTTDVTWATAGDVNSAEDLALQINAQVDGASANVVGGHIVVTSDSTGEGSAIAIGTGTCGLAWDTAVDGTANTGALLKGTLLARNSSTTKLVPYVSGGSNATGTPLAVLPAAETWTTTGDKRLRCLFGGRVIQENLVAHDVAGAVPIAAIQTLISNSTIVPVQSSATGA
jgi:hypothetical protein